MALVVLEADAHDLYRLFEICSLAFDHNGPHFDTNWPAHWTDSGRLKGAERFKQAQISDRHTIFLKAIDESNRIVGMAKWNFYDGCVPDSNMVEGNLVESGDVDDDSDDARKYLTALNAKHLSEKHATIRKTHGHLASLDMLATDPAHHRRGVGSALMDWDIRKVDELGVDAVVESSVSGRKLYEQKGFKYVRTVDCTFTGRRNERPVQSFAWLVRPGRMSMLLG
jgi:ribosomal protein S18 acetylase RimI-like enzyme